jgi:hypothetical protein
LGVSAIALMGVGAAWWFAPAFIAPKLGMTLQQAVGLSTQVGDLGSFFLVAGACILIALLTQNRLWFRPAFLLIGTAALGRIVAWALHDATLAWDMLAVELPIAALLAFAASRQERV